MLNIKRGIHAVHILLIQLFTQLLHAFSEALEMDDLPFPQELDHIVHIRIIGKTQNIIVGGACLLLWERIA